MDDREIVRAEAIARREAVREMPRGPAKRVAKQMHQLISQMDHLMAESSQRASGEEND